MFSLFSRAKVVAVVPSKPPKAKIDIESCKINGKDIKVVGFDLYPGFLKLHTAEFLSDIDNDNLIAIESSQGHFRWRARLQWTSRSEIVVDPIHYEYGFKLERV